MDHQDARLRLTCQHVGDGLQADEDRRTKLAPAQRSRIGPGVKDVKFKNGLQEDAHKVAARHPRTQLLTKTPLMLEICVPESGVAASKLSKMTLPGAFASTCQVPPLTSKMIDDVEIEEFQVSVYRCVQVPGTPPVPVAVSKSHYPSRDGCAGTCDWSNHRKSKRVSSWCQPHSLLRPMRLPADT